MTQSTKIIIIVLLALFSVAAHKNNGWGFLDNCYIGWALFPLGVTIGILLGSLWIDDKKMIAKIKTRGGFESFDRAVGKTIAHKKLHCICREIKIYLSPAFVPIFFKHVNPVFKSVNKNLPAYNVRGEYRGCSVHIREQCEPWLIEYGDDDASN